MININCYNDLLNICGDIIDKIYNNMMIDNYFVR